MTAGSEFLSPPLALFGTINGFELLVVVAAALMVFGSRLPEVALRAVAHVMRARRAVSKMWRDTGLEDELRRVRRDIELNIPRAADFDVTNPSPPAVIDEHDDHLIAKRRHDWIELGQPLLDGAHDDHRPKLLRLRRLRAKPFLLPTVAVVELVRGGDEPRRELALCEFARREDERLVVW